MPPAPAPARDLLRLTTCGSVDDGKSTLIGRLLHDAGRVPEDQMAAVVADSHRHGTQGPAPDLALLVDGLAAEREQGITIDVAYRYFSTPRRAFILADAPGHEQHTRNMVTAASTADLAVVLVDARKGVLPQTRRHTVLTSLLGVRRVILAVNKMDLVGWSQEVFDAVVEDYRAFADRLELEVEAVPLSALTGANVVARGDTPDWWRGTTLLERLERIEVVGAAPNRPLRIPVQWVNRPDDGFRGYAGMIVAGQARPGDPVRILPSGRTSRIERIVGFDRDLDRAGAGSSALLTLEDETDVARGDLIVAAQDAPEVADQFEASVVWMTEAPLLPGRTYLLKHAARTIPARVTDIRHRLGVETLEEQAARTLILNEIGVCHLSLDAPIAFEPYAVSRDLGGFILIDRETNATVGAGMIRFALRRAHNIHRQALEVSRADRAALKGQSPKVIWFTGLSGAGKSTIANALERRLAEVGRHTALLDGDNVRHGLNRDLGFTDADRVENIRRVAEVARLMADAGLIVLVSFISPFRADRLMARELQTPGDFVEVFVDAPLAVAEGRDPKGLYAKARRGELANFTGIDSPYEAPVAPDIRIDTEAESVDAACDRILALLDA